MKNLSESANTYLANLNLPFEDPSLSYLESICKAQLHAYPFENISKLLYFRDKSNNKFEIPPFDLYVENFKKYNFGGTCYILNSNLKKLLEELGFECYYILLGKVHMGIIVKIDNERYYVDAGAGAPFFKPVRFENGYENITTFALDRIYLLPVNLENGDYKYVRYNHGRSYGEKWNFNVEKKLNLTDFSELIIQSNQPENLFMSTIRCQIYQTDQNRSVSLVNNKFSIYEADGTSTVKILTSIDEVEEVIAKEFLLPKLPISEAVDFLKLRFNIDIFSK